MGAAYLNILETGPLAGIEDRRYCNMRWWCHTLTGQVRCYDFLVRSEKGDQ